MPFVSPDGSRISLFRSNPNLGHDRFALFVVGVNGGAARQRVALTAG